MRSKVRRYEPSGDDDVVRRAIMAGLSVWLKETPDGDYPGVQFFTQEILVKLEGANRRRTVRNTVPLDNDRDVIAWLDGYEQGRKAGVRTARKAVRN